MNEQPALSNKEKIILTNVSKFYGEVLGVNKINLVIPEGITSLVGPNGSGKTTLMNLMTGLIRPSKGTIRIFDVPVTEPNNFFEHVGYCTQYEPGFHWMTGYDFIYSMLLMRGHLKTDARDAAIESLEQVGLSESKNRKIGAFSKGMRQRIKIALAIAHRPQALILDEPLHGLDPMARIEMIDLFHNFAGEHKLLVISSHILHEVETLSDNVVILNHGYVVAEGNVHNVRGELKDQHPLQIFIQCDNPALLSSRLFELDGLVSVNVLEDERGVLVRTRNTDSFYELINRLVVDKTVDIQTITPADDNVQALYDYLVGRRKYE